jgi:hypothetical protein
MSGKRLAALNDDLKNLLKAPVKNENTKPPFCPPQADWFLVLHFTFQVFKDANQD